MNVKIKEAKSNINEVQNSNILYKSPKLGWPHYHRSLQGWNLKI